ncbi:MAG TPA: DNA gyrase subunit A [Candidatus Gracilibacteria bacterium]|nr:DNA gyrase subunit A [Candidatus Gracilibacteria bacterium]
MAKEKNQNPEDPKKKKSKKSEEEQQEFLNEETEEQEVENTEENSENTPEEISEDSSSENGENSQETISEFLGNIADRSITHEMETSYLEYAMSVIVSRALPDVRDGLKPVHRRILYAMNEIGLRSSGSFRKSAAVVGEVLAKYHPHGDSAVYDSMVRMAQDFAMRYTLVRGQGNFGSIDGDSAAAMRYTEAKMEKITDEMLGDIDKETVNWMPNYDGRFMEPIVLPTKIPQLLLNGSQGIAVGMATSIPPHNLGELIDGIIFLADKPEAELEELMQYIKGPDFPTGGILYNIADIKTAYATGRGGMVLRARAEIVEKKGGKFAIIVTEIPYQVNKSTLVMKIADLVRDKKIVGISDIRDESNRHGIRVVIELKKDAYPKKILNQLFKYTQMQTSFNMNMIALVDDIQPHLLDLKKVLEYFILHRKEVITRRTQFELKVALARAHILEGLKIALDNIDAVIETIRKSPTKEEAQENLMKKFKLSEEQSKAILEMRLQTLAGLERQKIEDEYKEKLALIEELKSILADTKKVLKIMKDELAEIKLKYGDERKTEIVPSAVGEISQKDTIPNEPMIVVLSKANYIKRIPPSSFKAQHRGGKGIIGGTTKEEDEIKLIIQSNNHDELLYFTNKGRVFKLPVYEIPQGSRISKGQAIVNLLQLQDGENITAILNAGENYSGEYLFMTTTKGTVKKTPIEDFKNVRKNGLIAIKLRADDSLEWVRQISTGNEVMIVTKEGKCIRFAESDVRPMGRPSIGVRGIRVKGGDNVVQMDVVPTPETTELLVVMENGLGKMTKVTNYRFQGRGGSGVKTANVTEKTGKVIGAKTIEKGMDADLIIMSKSGQTIRMHAGSIPSQGRATQGVYLMRLRPNDKVASLSLVEVSEENNVQTPESQQTEISETEEAVKTA